MQLINNSHSINIIIKSLENIPIERARHDWHF